VGKLLHRKTVGIIGAGRIGAAFAKMMATGHKMNVVYHDIVANPELEKMLHSYGQFLKSQGEDPIFCKRLNSVDDVLKTADVVSLHTVLVNCLPRYLIYFIQDPSTRHLINRERLSMMKETAILVNTSRGPVIDEAALVAHCQKHPTFFAALDVFEREPSMEPGLAKLPNVVIVPHIASATEWTRF
jgi:hydroxypyruvate reductase 1